MPPIEVTRTYLKLKSAAALNRAALPPGIRLVRLDPCTPATYRAMYAEVGGPWYWHDRDAWPDDALGSHLQHPTVRVYRLEQVPSTFLGYVELERHPDGTVEILYFGLVPDATGQGIGKGFLTAAVDEAFAMGASWVWLHTCTLDHPAARTNYETRGFLAYRQETYIEEINA